MSEYTPSLAPDVPVQASDSEMQNTEQEVLDPAGPGDVPEPSHSTVCDDQSMRAEPPLSVSPDDVAMEDPLSAAVNQPVPELEEDDELMVELGTGNEKCKRSESVLGLHGCQP